MNPTQTVVLLRKLRSSARIEQSKPAEGLHSHHLRTGRISSHFEWAPDVPYWRSDKCSPDRPTTLWFPWIALCTGFLGPSEFWHGLSFSSFVPVHQVLRIHLEAPKLPNQPIHCALACCLFSCVFWLGFWILASDSDASVSLLLLHQAHQSACPLHDHWSLQQNRRCQVEMEILDATWDWHHAGQPKFHPSTSGSASWASGVSHIPQALLCFSRCSLSAVSECSLDVLGRPCQPPGRRGWCCEVLQVQVWAHLLPRRNVAKLALLLHGSKQLPVFPSNLGRYPEIVLEQKHCGCPEKL